MSRKKVYRLEELNMREIENLNKNRSIVIIPISPLEVHGPHLPLGTDILVTEEISKEIVKRLEKKRKSLSIVLYPTIPIGYCGINMDLPGSISVDVRSFGRVIYDTLKYLSIDGFRYIVILTFHADPFYIKAIHKAIERIERKYVDIKIVEPLSRIFYDGEKSISHAGKEETSIMLYLYPYLISEDYKNLKNVKIKQSVLNFRKTLREMGADEGYVGDPSKATIELGRKIFGEIVDFCVLSILELLEGKYKYEMPEWLRYLPLFTYRK